MTTYFVVMGTILGLVLGSFLNALAYRLPRGESLMTRSHCTVCFKQITAWENIPVISWLALRGRCSGCRSPISMRYPLVEAGTALIFGVFTYLASGLGTGFFFGALILLTFAFVTILVALIDLDTFKIPSGILYNGAMIILAGAIGYQLVTGDGSRGWSALAFAGIYLVLYFIIWYVYPKGLGFGDVRLAALIGFVLGWVSFGAAVIGFFLPWFLAFLWLIPGMLQGTVSGKSKIPFGPWMVLGSLISVAYGDILFSGYLQLGGL